MSVTEEVVNTNFKSHHVRLVWKLNDWKLSRQYHGSQTKHLTSPVFSSPHCKWELEVQFNFDSTPNSSVASRMRACLYLLECDARPSSVVLQGFQGIQCPGSGWYICSKLFDVLSVGAYIPSEYWNIQATVNVIEVVADFNVLVGNPVPQLLSSNATATAAASDNSGAQARILTDALDSLLSSDELCDVTVFVNKKAVGGHKVVFAARSPVFKAMIEKARDKRCVELEVECASEEAWSVFQRFLYTGKTGVEESKVRELSDDLFRLAKEYQVSSLTAHLLTRLRAMLGRENVLEVLEIAYRNDEATLQEAGVGVLKKHLSYLRSEKMSELVSCVRRNTDMASMLLGEIGSA